MSEASPGNSTPWRRDPATVADRLGDWARSFRNDDRATISEVRMPQSGMANDTVMFRLGDDALVARLAPAPGSSYPTFRTYDLAFQRRVIELVRTRSEVPVPEIVYLEESDVWLDAPFMVTRLVEGQVPSDNPPYLLDPSGWFLQGSPEEWERFEHSTIDVMRRVHQIELDEDDIAFLSTGHRTQSALSHLLESMGAYYEWARDGHTIPVLERALEVLTLTLPANDRQVLNWGDSRPGNIIYRDFRPAAVLDWEMAGVGPPEVDLAWTTFFQRFFASMADQYGLPPVPAMFHRDQVKAAYERLSSDRVEDLAWYEALAGLRFGIIVMRMNLRSTMYGMQEPCQDPNEMVMFAPLLERLLDEI